MIPPIIRTALQQEGGASLAEGIQVEDNTRGDRDWTLDDDGEHLLDMVEEPRMKSHQPQSSGITNIKSPYVVKVLMEDGRVLAEIIEQTGDKNTV